MDKFDRIHALHRIFSARRYPVDMPTLCGFSRPPGRERVETGTATSSAMQDTERADS